MNAPVNARGEGHASAAGTESGGEPRRSPTALVLWFASSILGTICGVGGGIFATPILHYLVRLPLQLAVGTSLVLVFAMTVVATIVEFARADSALDWVVVGLLLVGSIPGAQVGYRFGKRIDAHTLKVLFIAVLLGAALRTYTLHGAAGAGELGRAIALDVPRVAWVIAVGFGGGFLAPLLGVGGGILVIPALFLTLPEMNYLEARACSMAMSIVNSAQSVWLHVRGGTVHFKIAAPFTVLAVIGALLGVWAVHRPGWAEVARVAMTVVLVLVALRFAWDVWALRRSSAATRS